VRNCEDEVAAGLNGRRSFGGVVGSGAGYGSGSAYILDPGGIRGNATNVVVASAAVVVLDD